MPASPNILWVLARHCAESNAIARLLRECNQAVTYATKGGARCTTLDQAGRADGIERPPANEPDYYYTVGGAVDGIYATYAFPTVPPPAANPRLLGTNIQRVLGHLAAQGMLPDSWRIDPDDVPAAPVTQDYQLRVRRPGEVFNLTPEQDASVHDVFHGAVSPSPDDPDQTALYRIPDEYYAAAIAAADPYGIYRQDSTYGLEPNSFMDLRREHLPHGAFTFARKVVDLMDDVPGLPGIKDARSCTEPYIIDAAAYMGHPIMLHEGTSGGVGYLAVHPPHAIHDAHWERWLRDREFVSTFDGHLPGNESRVAGVVLGQQPELLSEWRPQTPPRAVNIAPAECHTLETAETPLGLQYRWTTDDRYGTRIANGEPFGELHSLSARLDAHIHDTQAPFDGAPTFILGPDSPEMFTIEHLLASTGQPYRYATINGERVHAGNSDEVNGYSGPQDLAGECAITIDCSWETKPEHMPSLYGTITPGDNEQSQLHWAYATHANPGFVPGMACAEHLPTSSASSHGRGAGAFMNESVLSQVIGHLAGRAALPADWVVPDTYMHVRAHQAIYYRDGTEPGFYIRGHVTPGHHMGSHTYRVPAEYMAVAAASYFPTCAFRGECLGITGDRANAEHTRALADYHMQRAATPHVGLTRNYLASIASDMDAVPLAWNLPGVHDFRQPAASRYDVEVINHVAAQLDVPCLTCESHSDGSASLRLHAPGHEQVAAWGAWCSLMDVQPQPGLFNLWQPKDVLLSQASPVTFFNPQTPWYPVTSSNGPSVTYSPGEGRPLAHIHVQCNEAAGGTLYRWIDSTNPNALPDDQITGAPMYGLDNDRLLAEIDRYIARQGGVRLTEPSPSLASPEL